VTLPECMPGWKGCEMGPLLQEYCVSVAMSACSAWQQRQQLLGEPCNCGRELVVGLGHLLQVDKGAACIITGPSPDLRRQSR
jgi:hypothetical protein